MSDNPEEKPSKSQKKRDMEALRDLATRLTELNPDDIRKIDDPAVRESVTDAKKITKGNAKKRQIQYIAKLLTRTDVAPIQEIVDILDASSTRHIQVFHQLESWRERLIEGDAEVMAEIFNLHPRTDRPKLRALVRNAISERQRNDEQVHFRRLFQFLKTLDQS